MEKSKTSVFTTLIEKENLLTINQLLDLINENFTAVEIMGSFRLNDITEKLAEYKIKNSAGGNLMVENTKSFLEELEKIKTVV